MNERRPRVLLASHDSTPLPGVERTLAERGVDVERASTLVETCSRLGAAAFDLVVLQPLSGRIDGFEVAQLLERCGGARDDASAPPIEAAPSLLLVAPDPDGIARLLARATAGDVPDFVVAPPSAEELVLRIDAALRRRAQLARLARTARSLEQETITDFKTGLHNDRYFFLRLRQEVERSRRHKLALALALIDLDDFKAINERFDHVFGDFVLGAFARELRGAIRQIDLPARLGGDEFALLLPSTNLQEAALLATRLRLLLAEKRFEKGGRSTPLTISMGLDATPGDDSLEPEEFLRRADLALLEAKRRGKSRICLYSEIAPTRTTPA
jgi:diguanylate cyclase (GGDEF)-like protein